MTKRKEIQRLLKGDPNRTNKWIAEKLQTTPSFVATVRHQMGYKIKTKRTPIADEVLRLLRHTSPRLTYKTISETVGCTPSYVSTIAFLNNIKRYNKVPQEKWNAVREDEARRRKMKAFDLDKKILQIVYADKLVNSILEDL